MGRVAKIKMLEGNDYSRVNEVIRAHHYGQIDTMIKVLSDEGIEVHRSTLHRYTRKLEQIDGAKCQDENVTVVVIVTRATGATDTVLTPASAAQVRASIANASVDKL